MVDLSAYNPIEIVVMPSDELEQLKDESLAGMGHAIHLWAIEKEWRGPNAETQRTTGDDIALIHSEASEALEAFRECGSPTEVWWTWDVEIDGVKFKHCSREMLKVLLNADDEEDLDNMILELDLKPKPQGVGPELADVLVRILDYCEEHGIDLQAMMKLVMDHNLTRPVRHGGKHL
jgi:hypothetical protein